MKPNDYYDSELLYDSGMSGSKPPLFSVCLSTYNFENSVTQALKTLLKQTFSDYEIVVHDDKSKDNTCGVILNILNSNGLAGGGNRARQSGYAFIGHLRMAE